MLETDLIYPSSIHNHGIDKYNSLVYELKTKCKKMARTTQDDLRKIFEDETRTILLASEISFNECESSMYRSRRRLQSKISLTAIEFSVMLPKSTFETHHKFTVTATNHTAVIFHSERMKNYLSEISKIQSVGTFYTVPTQFSQLWTIFVVIDRHALPGIHCLMTSKDQELYTAILAKIHSLVPEIRPEISIFDWEPAPRNALNTFISQFKIRDVGSTLHNVSGPTHRSSGLFTVLIIILKLQCVDKKSYGNTIYPRKFNSCNLCIPSSNVSNKSRIGQIGTTSIYFKKRWITQIDPEELSIYEAGITTNNAAESYHAKLKSIIKTPHPRIWNFLTTLNNLIEDTVNEIGRLRLGQSISRLRKSSMF